MAIAAFFRLRSARGARGVCRGVACRVRRKRGTGARLKSNGALLIAPNSTATAQRGLPAHTRPAPRKTRARADRYLTFQPASGAGTTGFDSSQRKKPKARTKPEGQGESDSRRKGKAGEKNKAAETGKAAEIGKAPPET